MKLEEQRKFMIEKAAHKSLNGKRRFMEDYNAINHIRLRRGFIFIGKGFFEPSCLSKTHSNPE